MYNFVELTLFSRYRDNYFSEDHFLDLRKLRWRRAGTGQRGGLRILYYVQDIQGRIWLLTVYSKSARENITANDLKLLRDAVENAEII